MSSDQTIRLISAVAQLLGVLVWPAVVLFVIMWFRSGLADFLGNLGEFSFKAPGVEATAKRQEAAVALGAAVAVRAPGDGTPGRVADPREIAEALPSPRDQRRLQGSRVLWVDDRPSNNVFERQALEALGIQIDLSTSTEDALEKIRRRSYDLIISDMGRPPDERAATRSWTGFEKLGTRRRLSFTRVPGHPSMCGKPVSTARSAARTCRKNWLRWWRQPSPQGSRGSAAHLA